MFQFLFKRPDGKPEGLPGSAAVADGTGQGNLPADPARIASAERLAAIGDDEAAAADFILHCEFSDLRLAAAERLYSPEHLERVHVAIRNSDRRVAKLVHSRLDAIRHHQAEMRRGEECLALARQLLQDDKLTPNQVADLDRKWSVIDAPPLAGEFAGVREALARRLEGQVAQQRQVIDALAALRAQLDLGVRAPREPLQAALDALTGALGSAEGAALPRHLVSDAHAELERGRQLLAEPAPPPEPVQAAPAGPVPAEGTPAGEGGAAEQPPAPAAPRPAKTRAALPPPDAAFLARMDALEAALAQGALHTASDLDKALKETRGVKLSAAQSERLAHARSELKRLSDWARWGGNVSREQLIANAEQLQQEKMPMGELAQKVGGLRERWKKLDGVSGAAPKSLWDRFDAACSAAYAPAAAHFKHLAEERHASAAKAQALVEEASREAAALAGATPEWKPLAATVQRLTQAWSHLGPIDRKEKKRLDAEFVRAIGLLQAPLAERRAQERANREALIGQVRALDPHDRHCIDQLRTVQERWQQAARALPLERKEEQALWQQFRAACDELFARRKDSAHAADAERRHHLHDKEAICERLEQADAGVDGVRLLREAAAQWHAAGAVPRASEARIERRYHAAVSALQHRIDVARRDASLAQAGLLRERLRLVQELESAIAAGDAIDPQAWQARWDTLPALEGRAGDVLAARFGGAMAAVAQDLADYRERLAHNRERLMHDLLRLEVAAGVDSGAEFARERLKLQVEALQSSLKSGHKPATTASQFHELLALPALSDERTAMRIEQLYPRIGKDPR